MKGSGIHWRLRAALLACALCSACATTPAKHVPTAVTPAVRVSPAPDARAAGMRDVAALAPGIHIDMRYAGSDNFIGTPVRGYEAPRCYLLAPVAEALARVQAGLATQGLSLVVFDCYRPAQAVRHFVEWARDPSDLRTKATHYPRLEKAQLLDGYIAETSGHSRGATADVGLLRCDADARCTALDMGTGFDLFDTRANTDSPEVTRAQRDNRQRLLRAMQAQGFENYALEWWHYTFRPEPAPQTAYDFPVR
jgi:D-alanyl-D-alanine dipeptidase